MKKILISSALLAALSTSAFAEHGNVYFRLDGGISMVSSPATGDQLGNTFSETNTPFLGMGLGYYAGESFRAELNFMYHFNDNFALNKLTPAQSQLPVVRSILNDEGNYPNLIPITTIITPAEVVGGVNLPELREIANIANPTSITVQNTLKMLSIMPRLYFDLYDYGNGKVFVGAGVGYANLQAQSTITTVLTPISQANFDALDNWVSPRTANRTLSVRELPASFPNGSATISSPKTNNVAFSLHAGIDYKIPSMEGLKVNIEYSYLNYGQIKTFTVGDNDVTLDNPLKINMSNISFGLRMEM